MREVPANGFDGALVRSKAGQKGIIAVNSRLREASRKRFTIAHEIGRYVIRIIVCWAMSAMNARSRGSRQGLIGQKLKRMNSPPSSYCRAPCCENALTFPRSRSIGSPPTHRNSGQV